SALAAHAPDKILLVNGLGSTETTAARRALYETFVKRGYRFAAVIDPLALITGPVEIGDGGQILAGAVLQPGAVIGANVIINTRASIDHDCIVGAHAHIAPGATLSGGVWVGDGAHIGTGASVIQNIRVGVNGIVGAGAAIIADVPDDATVVGVPARVLKSKS
ncbi:MAG: sugar acetyltransferase, partial [Alphaproteobacteria bacterium]|nr:sugar acetyltransferase [Alphaproteobacteria bacterium]